MTRLCSSPACDIAIPPSRCQAPRADLWKHKDAIKARAPEDAAAAAPLRLARARRALNANGERGRGRAGPRREDGSLHLKMLKAGLRERNVLLLMAMCVRRGDALHP